MKQAALILILAACSFLGIYKSWTLKRRANELRAIITAVERLKTGVAFGRRDIPALLSELSADGDKTVFTAASAAIKGDTVYKGYERAKAAFCGSSALAASDWRLLDLFFVSVGRSGANEQLALCENTLSRLNLQLAEADGAYKKYGGVFARSGILAGLFFVIILM